jgi:hypothetical protein
LAYIGTPEVSGIKRVNSIICICDFLTEHVQLWKNNNRILYIYEEQQRSLHFYKNLLSVFFTKPNMYIYRGTLLA